MKELHGQGRFFRAGGSKEERVEVFGGESGFAESEPLALEADRVGSAREALRWMGQVAAKPWARGRAFLRHLADALTMALRDEMVKGTS